MPSGAMTETRGLADWATTRRWEHLTDQVRARLRVSILDSIGCGIAALGAPLLRDLRGYLAEVGGTPAATLIGGGRTSSDRAAFFNGAAIRYLDFNDTFAAPGESCHPSDNFAPVLAVAEPAGASGRELLVALAVAYQVQCRLGEIAPVRAKGFDHTVLGMLGMAAGSAVARGLGAEKAAHAIAITGTAFPALRVTRTGRLSNWKGLAAPNAAFGAVHAVALAAHGLTGPEQMFEGNKGLKEAITGPFEIDWSVEELDRVLHCSIKKHNAEFHSQSAIEAALAVRVDPAFDARAIERVHVRTFGTGFHIIGGGEEGDKKVIRSKEDADHSLPYIVAAALLDGEVTPRQYTHERMRGDDIRDLLNRVDVSLDVEYGERFPREMPAHVEVRLRGGHVIAAETSGYHGFHRHPFDWADAVSKFDAVTDGFLDRGLREEVVSAVASIESRPVEDLTALLSRISSASTSTDGRATWIH